MTSRGGLGNLTPTALVRPTHAAAGGIPLLGRRAYQGRVNSPRDIVAMAAVSLIIPIGLYAVGHAALNRQLYPLSTLLVAVYLHQRRSPWYIGLCLWSFFLVSLVRRLTDFQTSWDPSNPILLVPYLACLPAMIEAAGHVLRARRRALLPFTLILCCICYGTVLAMLSDRLASGIVDAMKWSAGPLMAIYILANQDRARTIFTVAEISFLTAGVAMSIYGVAQYINPTPWDIDWVVNVASLGMDSIGQPEPFALRVFSTMNSPGSLGAMLVTGIVLAMARPLWIAAPAGLLMLPGLLLTQYRAQWMAAVIGIACVFVCTGARTRSSILIVALICACSGGLLAMVPQAQQAIEQRLASLQSLSADASGEDRLQQYKVFLGDEDSALGKGLAINGPSRRLDKGATVIIDSGLIETFTAFGLLGGTIFFASIVLAIVYAARLRDPLKPALFGAVVATFVQIPFGSEHVGELGFGAWLFLGVAIALLTLPPDRGGTLRHPASKQI